MKNAIWLIILIVSIATLYIIFQKSNSAPPGHDPDHIEKVWLASIDHTSADYIVTYVDSLSKNLHEKVNQDLNGNARLVPTKMDIYPPIVAHSDIGKPIRSPKYKSFWKKGFQKIGNTTTNKTKYIYSLGNAYQTNGESIEQGLSLIITNIAPSHCEAANKRLGISSIDTISPDLEPFPNKVTNTKMVIFPRKSGCFRNLDGSVYYFSLILPIPEK